MSMRRQRILACIAISCAVGCDRTPSTRQECLAQATAKQSEPAIIAAANVCEAAFGKAPPAIGPAALSAGPSPVDLSKVTVTDTHVYGGNHGTSDVRTYNGAHSAIVGDVVFRVVVTSVAGETVFDRPLRQHVEWEPQSTASTRLEIGQDVPENCNINVKLEAVSR